MSYGSIARITQPRLALAVIVIGALLGLTACKGGLGATRDNSYQGARVTSKLFIPEDIKLNHDPDILPLPDFTGDELSDIGTTIAAPTAMLAPEVLNQITVQSLGDNSWLIAPENPSAVWPKLIRFLGRHQIGVRRTEPVIGVLESSWFTVSKTALASEQGRLRQVLAAGAPDAIAESEADATDTEADAGPVDAESGDISLYRAVFKVEQAVKQGFSEVHASIYQTSPPQDADALPDDSAATSVTSTQRVGFLKILASDLLQASSSTSVSLLADSINTEPKAELRSEDGLPTLLVHLGRSRFYAMLKKSLTNAEISFEEPSAAAGTTETASAPETATAAETTSDASPGYYNIELDRELLNKNQVKLPKGLRGRFHTLELHMNWEDGTGRIFVKGQGALPLPPAYAEQVLTLIREFSV